MILYGMEWNELAQMPTEEIYGRLNIEYREVEIENDGQEENLDNEEKEQQEEKDDKDKKSEEEKDNKDKKSKDKNAQRSGNDVYVAGTSRTTEEQKQVELEQEEPEQEPEDSETMDSEEPEEKNDENLSIEEFRRRRPVISRIPFLNKFFRNRDMKKARIEHARTIILEERIEEYIETFKRVHGREPRGNEIPNRDNMKHKQYLDKIEKATMIEANLEEYIRGFIERKGRLPSEFEMDMQRNQIGKFIEKERKSAIKESRNRNVWEEELEDEKEAAISNPKEEKEESRPRKKSIISRALDYLKLYDDDDEYIEDDIDDTKKVANAIPGNMEEIIERRRKEREAAKEKEAAVKKDEEKTEKELEQEEQPAESSEKSRVRKFKDSMKPEQEEQPKYPEAVSMKDSLDKAMEAAAKKVAQSNRYNGRAVSRPASKSAPSPKGGESR